MRPYDISDKNSIIEYAKKLLGNSLHSLYPNAVEVLFRGRGKVGIAVEKYHFKYNPNSISKPDFPEAGLELKCTPLKELRDNSLASKERLVLNIIDYETEARKTFYNSSFWLKNKDLLLMFYFHEYSNEAEPPISYLDFIFKIVREWDFSDKSHEVDLKIIRDDWEKIHSKIINNKAHEISEGDTFYLGACTKGSRAGAEMRKQYDKRAVKAQQRAYSLKSSYLNRIILDSIHKRIGCTDDLFVSENQRELWKKKFADIDSQFGSLVKKSEELNEMTLEQLIQSRFSCFYGKTVAQISEELEININTSSKSFAYDLCRAVLGVKEKKIREFEYSGLEIKTIQLESSGRSIKEHMSFSNIRYMEIVKERRWEDSFWYNTLTNRFLFVVFQKDVSNVRDKAVLKKIQFWTMPAKDLLVAKEFWLDTKLKIKKGDYNNFIKISDNMICHVRPKAQKSTDTMPTPQGIPEKKKCYWLNRSYIYEIVTKQ